MSGYFHPSYVRRHSVPVSAGSGHYRQFSKHSRKEIEFSEIPKRPEGSEEDSSDSDGDE